MEKVTIIRGVKMIVEQKAVESTDEIDWLTNWEKACEKKIKQQFLLRYFGKVSMTLTLSLVDEYKWVCMYWSDQSLNVIPILFSAAGSTSASRRARRGASGLVELRDSIKKTTIRGILMLHSPKDLCRRRCLINGRHFFKNLPAWLKTV